MVKKNSFALTCFILIIVNNVTVVQWPRILKKVRLHYGENWKCKYEALFITFFMIHGLTNTFHQFQIIRTWVSINKHFITKSELLQIWWRWVIPLIACIKILMRIFVYTKCVVKLKEQGKCTSCRAKHVFR